MSTIITGIVTDGVVVPNSPLPEGAEVEVVVVAEGELARLNDSGLELLKSMPNGLRGVPAAQVRGIAAGNGSPPDDDTVKRWIQEHRVEKYG